jgi:serine/threonine protein phosphatase PrpC
MAVEVRGAKRLGGLLSRLAEPRECRVAAASRPGLLRRLRPGAPSADRHAVVLRPDLDYVMVAAFAGHGPHGAQIAELAADTISDVLERRLLRGAAGERKRSDSGVSGASSEYGESSVESASVETASGSSADGDVEDDVSAARGKAGLLSPSAAGPDGADLGADDAAVPGGDGAFFPVSVELAMQDAFVEASIAVDATPWARHSGTTATVAVIRAGVLVVGAIGDGAVILGRRRSGRVTLQRLTAAHRVGDDAGERARVERFGGTITAGHVADGGHARVLAVSRTLGDTDMRRAGVCQLPQIGSMPITHRDALVAVSTMPLWTGAGAVAPPDLSRHVDEARVARQGPFELSRRLLDAAFGSSGPAQDATLVCMQLRR